MASLWKRLTGAKDPVIGSKTDLSEIVCIVDRSGSMETIRNDAIGGFNAFLSDQREQPGEANLTLVLFDEQHECLHESVPIASVAQLTRHTFVPRGRTALFDAVGQTLVTINQRLAKQSDTNRAGKVIVSILTDGEENSSKEYTKSRIAEMIKQYRETGWEFFYLAANQDAFAAAAEISIAPENTVAFKADTEGVTEVMDTMSLLVSQSRVGWGSEEEKDESDSDDRALKTT